MVTAVKKGLRSSLEFARLEFISVLSQLVKAYPSHPRFSSMAPLSHHEPEADFFENVKHIQLHRRTRAFRKLAGVCREGSLSQLSIMNFILPLANHVSEVAIRESFKWKSKALEVSTSSVYMYKERAHIFW